ncbi:hypothetical protein [Hymenobacter lapidiphilus]|uniref:hypothetical protein n=1 Tax=Hymenobacter sp. CCM 8763 TaxID=2303334 RepID=UPI0011C0D2AD|nr:hypothetical protein [Hymenobacter sp. CCM 8763]
MLAPLSLRAIIQFLYKKGWHDYKITNRFHKMSAPESISSSVKITLPLTDNNEFDNSLLHKVVDFISEFYEFPSGELISSFIKNSAIFSTQLIDESTTHGNVPFLRYEHHLQELKNLLLNNASFGVSGKHYVKDIPEEANTYLNLCSFLQTERGSFISKIQLPSSIDLSVNLFEEYSVQSDSINNKLGSVLKFVVDDIYKSPANDIYSVEHVKQNAQLINIDVFENINNIFKRTGVGEINFALLGADFDLKIESGVVGVDEFKQLENYIDLASTVFANHVEIDSRGRVIQLRSSHAKGSKNLVIISRSQSNLKPIHVELENNQYDLAITAHKAKSNVFIKGTALETKQYLRIVRLMDFHVV